MTNDQLIALFASIGACLSAMATFLSVRQIAKQREESYRPELAFSFVSLKCSKDPTVSSPIPTHWLADGKDVTAVPQAHSFSLPLRNVGLGAAKAVSLSWSFPFDAVTQQVNELAQKSLSAAYYTFKKEIFSLESQDFEKNISMWVNQKQDTMDYILPAVVDHNPSLVTIPHAYIQIVSSLIYFCTLKTDFDHFPEIPPLVLHMEYSDIGDIKHYALFNIQFKVSGIMGKGELFYSNIEAKKIA